MKLQQVDTRTLPGITLALSDHGRNALGALGEQWARLKLESSGYAVRYERQPGQGDLTAVSRATGEIFHVEVKTARRCSDKKWRFLLWKKNKQDHRQADIVLLLAVLPTGHVVPFVVPSVNLAKQRQAVITSHPNRYGGKLSAFRQRGRLILEAIC